MPDRMPPIPEAEQTEEQRAAAVAFASARGNPVFGPFVPLHRSPELMLHFQKVGGYCRYRNALGLRLSEFIILMVARRHSQDVEWDIHSRSAAKQASRRTRSPPSPKAAGRRP